MKYNHRYILVLLFVSFQSFGQGLLVDSILALKVIKVKKIDITDELTTLSLKMEFGDDKFEDQKKLEQLDLSKVNEIDLVYTSYKLSQNFDQQKLNKNRLKTLLKIKPELENTPLVWKVIAIEDFDENTAHKSFNGFLIHLKIKPKSTNAASVDIIENGSKISVSNPNAGKNKRKNYLIGISKDKTSEKITKEPLFNNEKDFNSLKQILDDSLKLSELERVSTIKVNTSYIYEFYIQENGQLINPKVVSGIDYGTDRKIIRVLENLPKWRKGKTNGITIRYELLIRINEK